MVPEKTIERLSLYRRLIEELIRGGKTSVYSYELARLAGVNSSQVRRDFMFIGTNGRSNSGYDLEELLASVKDHLISNEPDVFALVGIGNLGRAILAFFQCRTTNLQIKAAFDQDLDKVNRVTYGCRSYPVGDLKEVLRAEGIRLGVITVPSDFAQETADKLVDAGVTGIVNFAPLVLSVPEGVFVENIDLTMFLEKVAHFSRNMNFGVKNVKS